MAMEEQWLRLIILVGLLWLGRQLWAHAVTWVLLRGRCRWPRRLRPRTPHDCPACCQATDAVVPAPVPTVSPWRSAQRRRGRPPTIATAGHACPNPACRYYGITDAAVHALVGCGHHGREHIQDWFRCTFRDRRPAPLPYSPGPGVPPRHASARRRNTDEAGRPIPSFHRAAAGAP